MTKYISVEDGKLCANKKGLRMKVVGVEVDEQGYLKKICIAWSQYRVRTTNAWVHIENNEKICLKTEQQKGSIYGKRKL